VTYTADGNGYIADVKYSGEPVYAPAPAYGPAPVPAYGAAPIRTVVAAPAPIAVAAPAPIIAPLAPRAILPAGPLLRPALAPARPVLLG
jgi:2-oxoglutarate dehydrogenase E2 component (dihydrolipoamide succinyltransferase)